MARRKSESGKTAREGVSVKIDRELHRKLSVMAAGANVDMYELLDEIIRQPIETRYRRFTEKESAS